MTYRKLRWREANDRLVEDPGVQWLQVDNGGMIVYYGVQDREHLALDAAKMLCKRRGDGLWVQCPKPLNVWPGEEEAWELIERWPPRRFSGDGLIDVQFMTTGSVRDEWRRLGLSGLPLHLYLESSLRQAAKRGGQVTEEAAGRWEVLVDGVVTMRTGNVLADWIGLPAWASDDGELLEEPPVDGYEFDDYFLPPNPPTDDEW